MPPRDTATKLPSAWKATLGVAYAAAAALLFWLAWDGAAYYGTPLIERPRHPAYWTLKPGGTRGHSLGVVGASLLVLMLVYSVRKRVRGLESLGPLRAWLHFHIFCGVVGTLLVVLHSSFKVRGLVALSFWSMIVVALSGVLGRYLYLQIPRTRAGDELTLEETQRSSAAIAERVLTEFGVEAETLERLDAEARGGVSPDIPLLLLLVRIPLARFALRGRLRRILRGMPPSAKGQIAELSEALRERTLLEQRLALWNRLHDLFHYWHVFHKPFALIMYLFLILHVTVVVMTGYAWGG